MHSLMKPSPQSRQRPHICCTQESFLCPFVTSSSCSSPHPQATTDTLPASTYQFAFSKNFVQLEESYRMYSIFGPVSFTQHNYFEIYSCCRVYQQLSPFYAEWYSIAWINHNLFIYSFHPVVNPINSKGRGRREGIIRF